MSRKIEKFEWCALYTKGHSEIYRGDLVKSLACFSGYYLLISKLFYFILSLHINQNQLSWQSAIYGGDFTRMKSLACFSGYFLLMLSKNWTFFVLHMNWTNKMETLDDWKGQEELHKSVGFRQILHLPTHFGCPHWIRSPVAFEPRRPRAGQFHLPGRGSLHTSPFMDKKLVVIEMK